MEGSVDVLVSEDALFDVFSWSVGTPVASGPGKSRKGWEKETVEETIVEAEEEQGEAAGLADVSLLSIFPLLRRGGALCFSTLCFFSSRWHARWATAFRLE